MFGAILGDIIGSPYEFDGNNIKTTEFPLFCERSRFTDDSVMTIAVAKGAMNGYGNEEKTENEIRKSMINLGRKYPNIGYGSRFSNWLYSENPIPYNSFGNGSAMRVSSIAWLYNDIDDVEKYAEISAKVTHNHPEGIKGAKAIAGAIFLAREGVSKDFIKKYIEEEYKYNLNATCDEIRPDYHFVASCQGTIPQAIIAFLEGDNFEEVIRLAVSLGGDSDTIAAIAGSIAEAYYEIPNELYQKAILMMSDDLNLVLKKYIGFLDQINKNE